MKAEFFIGNVKCNGCKNRWTTYERIEGDFARIFVIKRDKSRELFDKKKIMRGIIIIVVAKLIL